MRDGLEISPGRLLKVSLKCFVCDTPARAFVKSIIGHGGYYACERCTIEGVRFEETEEEGAVVMTNLHRCVYPEVNCEERTDISFRNRDQQEHHHGISPITRITPPINMIFVFILDFMHLCCLGVMKRLYKHFLLLHAACRILSCEKFCTIYRNYAKDYLTRFFVALRPFYGLKSQILNFHHLIHLSDDVQAMGCSVSKITAFPFENLLGKIKRRFLRSSNRCLAQVCRRFHEEDVRNKSKKQTLPPEVEVLRKVRDKILQIKYKQNVISTASPNNTVLLENNVVLEVKEILSTEDSFQIKGNIWKQKKSLFKYPFDSKHLQMWQLESEPSRNVHTHSLASVQQKMLKLNINFEENGREKIYVIPLLH